jgi:hypothetical protein
MTSNSIVFAVFKHLSRLIWQAPTSRFKMIYSFEVKPILRRSMKPLNCTSLVVVLSAMIGMSSLLHGSASALPGMAIVQAPTQLTWGPAPPQLPKGVHLAVLAGDPKRREQMIESCSSPSSEDLRV